MECQNNKPVADFLGICIDYNVEIIEKMLKHYNTDPLDDPDKANIIVQTYLDLILAEYRRKYNQ